MLKKLIYFLVALFVGAFFVFQSCNENTPISNQESPMSAYKPVNVGTLHGYDLVGSDKPVQCAPTPGTTLELYAGTGNNSGILVGHVYFTSISGGYLNVRYSLDAAFGWGFQSIHFGIYELLSQIPLNSSGNVSPGQLTFVENYSSSYPTLKDIQVPLPTGYSSTKSYYIIAHSTVCQGDIGGFIGSLPPNPVNLCATGKKTSCGYWEFDLTNAGLLSGHYCGWCIDVNSGGLQVQNPCTTPNPTYLYSSYQNPLPPEILSMVSYPQNLDIVNWILNNFTVGSTVNQYDYQGSWTVPPVMSQFINLNTTSTVTAADIQYAIWMALEDGTGTYDGVISTSGNIFGILYSAFTNGEGFIPGPGQKIGLIVIPHYFDGNGIEQVAQPMLTTVTLGSTGCGTALGDGSTGKRIGSTWFTYFKWNELNCPSLP